MSLTDLAAHVVVPAGAVASRWPRVRDTCANIGLRFDEWQDESGRVMLALDEAGDYAATTEVLSLPRQTGKSSLLSRVSFGLGLTEPGLTAVWTAHQFKTAQETFAFMRSLAVRERVAPHVRRVVGRTGSEAIEFENGSRILFGARSVPGAFVGFSGIGLLILDEAQKLTPRMMSDLTPTMNSVRNALIIMAGTPPGPEDDGSVFAAHRDAALSGESDHLLYIEFSGDTIEEANPSYPHRTGPRAVSMMRKSLTGEAWERQALGKWAAKLADRPPIDPVDWAGRADAGPGDDVRPNALGVDSSGGRWSVAACWIEQDNAHVEEVFAATSQKAVLEFVAERAKPRMPVVIAANSEAAALESELAARRAKKVKVVLLAGRAEAAACVALEARFGDHRLTHAGQEAVTDALGRSRRRLLPDAGAGAWTFDVRDAATDIAPIRACTWALSGALSVLRPARAAAVRIR